MKLVGIEQVKTRRRVDIKVAIEELKGILKDGVVKRAVVVDDEARIVGNDEVFEALRLLSAERVPVVGEGEDEEVDFPLEALGVWKQRSPRGLKVFESVLEMVEGLWPTPLVKLSASTPERRIFAKLECFNPFSNSIKDRVGWYLMKGVEGDLIYEATSANTGISLASMASILGKKVRVYVPESIGDECVTALRLLGAEVVKLPVKLTVEGLERVKEDARRDKAVHPNQFENDLNFEVHMRYTARELDEQLTSMGLRPDYLIGALGTSGHMSALSLYFKSKYGTKVVGVQPSKGEVIPGMRRVESGMKWYEWAEFDELVDVRREDAVRGIVEIARRDGILVGMSSGAVYEALKSVEGKGTYVLIFPDSGYKYLDQLKDAVRA